MMLVPLLVGIAVVVVALAARSEARNAVAAPEDPALRIAVADPAAGPAPNRNPLTDAFPQFRLWVPERDTVYQATCRVEGSAGPDIVIRSVSDAA